MLDVGSTAVMVFECSGIEMKLPKAQKARALTYVANLSSIIYTLARIHSLLTSCLRLV